MTTNWALKCGNKLKVVGNRRIFQERGRTVWLASRRRRRRLVGITPGSRQVTDLHMHALTFWAQPPPSVKNYRGQGPRDGWLVRWSKGKRVKLLTDCKINWGRFLGRHSPTSLPFSELSQFIIILLLFVFVTILRLSFLRLHIASSHPLPSPMQLEFMLHWSSLTGIWHFWSSDPIKRKSRWGSEEKVHSSTNQCREGERERDLD